VALQHTLWFGPLHKTGSACGFHSDLCSCPTALPLLLLLLLLLLGPLSRQVMIGASQVGSVKPLVKEGQHVNKVGAQPLLH